MVTLYLIFAHHQQDQLVRLVSSIRQLSPKSIIAIHYDPKNDILNMTQFSKLNVIVIPNPVIGEWGGFSLVEQYKHAIGWCLKNLKWDWLCTITGLSYPINNLQLFEKKLVASGYDAFIRYFDAFEPPKGVWPTGEGQKRYLFRYYNLPSFPYYHKLPTIIKNTLHKKRENFNNCQPFFKIIPLSRNAKIRLGIRRINSIFNQNFKLYAGRQMMNLNRKATHRIFDFLSNNPNYENFFKTTLIPDEAFFITILMNSSDIKICNNVMRYIKWPKDIDASSVTTITKDEVNQAMASGNPFGLKFDADTEPNALDYIDLILGLIKAK